MDNIIQFELMKFFMALEGMIKSILFLMPESQLGAGIPILAFFIMWGMIIRKIGGKK